MGRFDEFKKRIVEMFRKHAKSSYNEEKQGTEKIESTPEYKPTYTNENGETIGYSTWFDEHQGEGSFGSTPVGKQGYNIYDSQTNEYKHIGHEAWMDEHRGEGQPFDKTSEFKPGYDYHDPITDEDIHVSYSALVEHGYEILDKKGPHIDPTAKIDNTTDPITRALASIGLKIPELSRECKSLLESELSYINDLATHISDLQSKLELAEQHGVNSPIQDSQRDEIKLTQNEINNSNQTVTFAHNLNNWIYQLNHLTSNALVVQHKKHIIKTIQELANAIINDPDNIEKNRLIQTAQSLQQELDTLSPEQNISLEQIFRSIQRIQASIREQCKKTPKTSTSTLDKLRAIHDILSEMSLEISKTNTIPNQTPVTESKDFEQDGM